jgi:putative ABC transport system permease protein
MSIATLKLAVKVLLRRKFFTAVSLFAISVTLVVLMVAAALLDHVVGAMPPESRQDRMLNVRWGQMTHEHSTWNGTLGYGFLDRHVRPLAKAEAVTIHSEPDSVVGWAGGEKVTSWLKRTDGVFFRVFDFTFLEGSPYGEEDDANARPVAVINAATRRKFFGNTPALGRTIDLDGQTFRVAGVVADVPFFRALTFSDVWAPLSTAKTDSYKVGVLGDFNASILARSPADFDTIREDLASRLPLVELPKPYKKFVSAADRPLDTVARELVPGRHTAAPTGALVALLAAAALLFMLLPAVNLVNLNVSRMLERASEIGVRKAFGASSRNLVGQFLAENVVVCLVGGVLGWAGSALVLAGIGASGVIPYAAFHLNGRIFLAGLGVTVAFGVLSGLYPAWKMSRLHPVEALKGVSR